MVFSDLFFLYVFLPAFLLCYFVATTLDRRRFKKHLIALSEDDNDEDDVMLVQLAPALTLRNATLVVFSLLFYAWGEPVYVFLMLACVVINFFAGRIIDASGEHRKKALIVGVACNILILCTFKYLGFLAAQLLGLGIPVGVPNIALPIGISFYTFQSISYLVDVYRRESKAQRRFSDLLLYISMFPQLIAGPIVRYGTVAEEINDRHVSMQDVSDGIFRFMIGLGKKVIIANQLSEVADQMLVNGLGSLTTTGAWIGILAFMFQIYFDFSGYSDMAIGIGRCLGFHFNENFDHPYCSRSITEFWRRWHMSLGSFFRDYVYIPLGGNRRHQAVNILVVWFLTGAWHGASWNFMFWGLFFGLIVMTEKYTLMRRIETEETDEDGATVEAGVKAKAMRVIDRIPRPVLHIYTLSLVFLSWGLFYFDDFAQMQKFFAAAFGFGVGFHDFVTESAFFDHFWIWVIAIAFSMPLRRFIAQQAEKRIADPERLAMVNTYSRLATSVIILIVSTALLVGATNNAFLYTRF